MYKIPNLPLNIDLETKSVMRQLNLANKKLAELKGIALTIPNESILINILVMQEAKESSAIENITTTHDEMYRAKVAFKSSAISSSAKEVILYANALQYGFNFIRQNKILTLNNIIEIQEIFEKNEAGLYKLPDTNLQNPNKEIVYTSLQHQDDIRRHMYNLVKYINDDTLQDIDPLIKLAIIHHQFESIHPFYDGNGRTGRIINSLYLILKDLLDLPILYLSKYIVRNKAMYYELLQSVRDNDKWEDWVIFMLKGIEETSTETIDLVKNIKKLMQGYKVKMSLLLGKSYSYELLNNLFCHPYTKIEFVMNDLNISRVTASIYLNKLTDSNLLQKIKMGHSNYYLNPPLADLFINHSGDNNVKFFKPKKPINKGIEI